jgi:hypothetical protein
MRRIDITTTVVEGRLGGYWFTRWSKRYPEMHEIHTKAMENSRKSACSAIDISEWFEILKKCKEES